MRILLDECIDQRLARDLKGPDVKTIPEAGWAGIDNGRLLELAEGRFGVFITVDRNLSFQQSLPKFQIAVLVLRAPTNRLADLRRLMPRIFEVLPTLKRGEATVVSV